MTARSYLKRFAAGSVLALVVSGLCFSVTRSFIPSWGATLDETARALPGDELINDAAVAWTNAITIEAPPESVWPWIAQMGDTRGGFYSYTFVENKMVLLAPDYQVVYTNASLPVAEWQQPDPGEEIIQGILKIHSLENGKWMLADSFEQEAFRWSWLWFLEPDNEGQHTRLLVRFRVMVPEDATSPVFAFVMDVGGFVMQQRMLQGLKIRAQGGTEPSYLEGLELSIWLSVLILGLASALLTIFQKDWRRPVLTGLVSIVCLFFITFVQPDIVLRLLLLSLLLLMFVWTRQEAWRTKAAPG
jgi:hypothetical protein